MKTKLVIFDLDGVLTDGETLIKQAQVVACAAQQAEITPAWAFEHAHGMAAKDTLKLISAYCGRALDYEQFIQALDVELDALMHKHLRATKNIAAQLERLQQQKLTFCIATGSRLEKAVLKLKLCGLTSWFPPEIIFTADMVDHGKPAPDIMLLAAKSMGFAPHDCVVIEDAPAGIKSAKAANMVAIGYTGGAHYQVTDKLNAASLSQAGADVVIGDHADLLSVIP